MVVSRAETLTSMPFNGRSCGSPSISDSRTCRRPLMVQTLSGALVPPPPVPALGDGSASTSLTCFTPAASFVVIYPTERDCATGRANRPLTRSVSGRPRRESVQSCRVRHRCGGPRRRRRLGVGDRRPRPERHGHPPPLPGPGVPRPTDRPTPGCRGPTHNTPVGFRVRRGRRSGRNRDKAPAVTVDGGAHLRRTAGRGRCSSAGRRRTRRLRRRCWCRRGTPARRSNRPCR